MGVFRGTQPFPHAVCDVCGETRPVKEMEHIPAIGYMCAAGHQVECVSKPGVVRTFASGADRDTDDRKIDPEGALSPLVLIRFCEYMREHTFRRDNTRRESDNWQKGIPADAYMKSLMRHVMDVWQLHREVPAFDADGNIVSYEDALCAVLFNVQGLLHEHLAKSTSAREQLPAGPSD